VAANGARHRGHKLDDRLVRHTDRVFHDASPENIRRNLLLLRKPVIEPVNQDVSINESGHGG